MTDYSRAHGAMGWDGARAIDADYRLSQLGVPSHLWEYCNFPLDDPHTGMLWVEPVSPAAQPELQFLAGLGFGIHVAPHNTFDLRDLGAAIKSFSKIHLTNGFGTAQPRYVGGNALESANAVTDLWIPTEFKETVDLSGLSNLTACNCGALGGASVVLNPKLRFLGLQLPRLPETFRIMSQLEGLRVAAGKGLRSASFLESPETLRSLRVDNTSSFDLASLDRCRSIESLWFYGCKELTSIASMLQMPSLRMVIIDGAHVIPEYEALIELDIPQFRVSNNHVFADTFQKQVADRSGWTFTTHNSRK